MNEEDSIDQALGDCPLHTGGVTDARDVQGNVLRRQGLLESLSGAQDKSPDQLLEHRLILLGRFVAEVGLCDDLTLLVARYRPG